jgi:hypothetical protein
MPRLAGLGASGGETPAGAPGSPSGRRRDESAVNLSDPTSSPAPEKPVDAGSSGTPSKYEPRTRAEQVRPDSRKPQEVEEVLKSPEFWGWPVVKNDGTWLHSHQKDYWAAREAFENDPGNAAKRLEYRNRTYIYLSYMQAHNYITKAGFDRANKALPKP